MKRVLPLLAAALLLLRPVCDVLASSEPGADVAFNAHATCENAHRANSNESAPCCASVDKHVVAKVAEPGAARLASSATAVVLAPGWIPTRYDGAALFSSRKPPGALPVPSYYARSTRILR
jgi:hypothetical protein